jgi:hypothetical protein
VDFVFDFIDDDIAQKGACLYKSFGFFEHRKAVAAGLHEINGGNAIAAPTVESVSIDAGRYKRLGIDVQFAS